MLALETKQSGGKLLPHSDLGGGGVFLGETSHSRQRGIKIGTWNVRTLGVFIGQAANQLALQAGLCTIE